MYAVYHGPRGLKRIAGRVHLLTQKLANALEVLGFKQLNEKGIWLYGCACLKDFLVEFLWVMVHP
jgi:glycine cleavage system pyridoxal-binding protein P